MRKIQIVILGLLAVLAFSALSVTSAFAVSQILVGAKEVGAAGAPLVASGSLLLEDTGAPGAPAVICKGIFVGKIEEGGTLGLVEALLTATEELLEGELQAGEENAPDLIECTKEKGECLETTMVEVRRLPWHVEIALNGAAFLLDFLEEAGHIPVYVVDCVTPLILISDECEGLSSARLFMKGAELLGSFNQLALAEVWGAESELANCSVGGAKKGLIETPEDSEENAGLLTSTAGALTLSE